MKLAFTLLLATSTLLLQAQEIADFESFDLPRGTFLNDAGGASFTAGDLFLPNDFNPEFNSWSGYAISSDTDALTPGFMNQYSAIAGSGANGSDNYAVAFVSQSFTNTIQLRGEAAGRAVPGLYVTNNTYAYFSMLDGDDFAKRFGGVTGDDPDFFLLTIKAYSGGNLSNDSVDFYLADYRFTDNSQDYIVDDWTWVDLSSLGAADSLSFSLSSTDNSSFGMNTPAYFCLDNVFAPNPIVSTYNSPTSTALRVFPNPSADFVRIERETSAPAICSVFDADGRLALRRRVAAPEAQIDLRDLPAGTYFIQLQSPKTVATTTLVKL